MWKMTGAHRSKLFTIWERIHEDAQAMTSSSSSSSSRRLHRHAHSHIYNLLSIQFFNNYEQLHNVFAQHWKGQKVSCAYCCMWTTWSSSAPIFWNQPSKVPVVEYIWDEGLGGPSILPRDWSDQHTRRDIAHSMTLCLEYNMFTFRSGRMTHILFNYYFWISFYWWVRYYFHHNSIQCIKLVCTIFFLN